MITKPLSIAKQPGTQDALVKRIPFFYGWVMLPVALIAVITTSPGQTFGVSVFNPFFRTALNLSHSQLTGAYMVGTLLAAVPQSFIGAIMDRFGIRHTMSVVVLVLGCACLFISQVGSLPALFFAFLALRMFGQGALSLLANNTLAMWFHKRLGTVSGIMNMGMAGATAAVPIVFLSLINAFGWRWAYAILGLGVWIVMFPLLIIFFRNRPEEVGQQPDGLGQHISDEILQVADYETHADQQTFTLKEAARTRAHWIALAMMVAWSMIGTGIVFNIIPLFQTFGLTAGDAAITFTTLAMSSAVMQLIGGLLADRLPLNWLASLSMVAMTIGVVLLMGVQTVWMAHLYALAFGMGQGLIGAVRGTLWARYYGRTHLGKIQGSVWTATVAGSSAGPFVMGFTFDLFGSYRPSLWIFLAIIVPLIVLTLFATPPPRLTKSLPVVTT